MLRKLSLLILSHLLLFNLSHAQFSATNNAPYNTPANLVNNVLLGNGVVASNVQFYGAPAQLGFFKGTNTVVGLDSGVVMTTRNIGQIPVGGTNGPAVPIGATSGGFGPAWMGTAASNNLLTVSASVPFLLGQTFPVASVVNDAAVLSFNFVPSADTVEFRYVFASQEWNQYPCGVYNDMFGFFVSGPGINGTYNSPPGFPNPAINVATFVDSSGTTLPITISSIHPAGAPNCSSPNALNGHLFNTNMPNNVDIQYNGLTVVMKAKFAVIPCDTYNIALAIGHAQDHGLQSSVFIEAKSFSSGQIVVDAQPSFNTFGNDSNLYEGCGVVDLEFKRFSSLGDSATARFDISGTAINGTDYSNIPDSVYFPPGANSASISFNINDDGVNEGVETLIITIFPDTTLPCAPGDTQVVTLYINDRPPVVSTTTHDTISCKEQFAKLKVNVTSGIPDYQYWWGTGDTIDSISVPVPVNDTMILVTVTDACGVDTVVDTANIIKLIPPFTISVPNDTVNCPDSGNLHINVTSGTAPYSYLWNNTSFSASSSITTGDTVTTWYQYTVTDQCHPPIEDSVAVVVNLVPLDFRDSIFKFDCNQDSIKIFPDSISGYKPVVRWPTGVTGGSIWVKPKASFKYKVTVSAACWNKKDTVEVGIDYNTGDPLKIGNYNDTTVNCPGDTMVLKPSIQGGFSPYKFHWNTILGDSTNKFAANNDSVMILRILDDCESEIIDTITVKVPVFDTIGIDLKSVDLFCIGRDEIVTSTVTGGNGTYNYKWTSNWPISNPDGDLQSTVNIQDTNGIVVLKITDGCNTEKTKEFKIVAENCIPSKPNVFSPNGDGVNDFLYLIDPDQFPGTEVYVYNRWGKLVYESKNYQNNWGGENLSDGTYFYTMILPDGRRLQSFVMIIR